MPTNVVLRFRDLLGEIGDTIKEHRNTINKFGYVWWGWWHRQNERIPHSSLLSFKKTISESGHIWVYLAHSDMLRLYRAKLVEIDIAENNEPKECREIDKVPEYYFFKKCLVWFRFDEIKDASSDEIKAWTYDDPADFLFEFKTEKFQGLRVSSLDEMIHSRHHRTMYFIQEYDKNLHEEHSKNLQNVIDKEKDNSTIEIENQIGEHANSILNVLEDIQKQCDFAGKSSLSPIQIPAYPKETEQELKKPAKAKDGFKSFISRLYKLVVDGHKKVFANKAIINRTEFYEIADPFYEQINLVRHDFQHLITPQDKKKLGKLNREVCGKLILDDQKSRIKFQLEMLKRADNFFKKELNLVKIRLGQVPE
jgi:hypothetical protein